MNAPLLRPVLGALLGLTLLAGCNKGPSSGSGAGSTQAAGQPSPDTVVATYGDNKKVTLKELDEKIKDQLADLDKRKHEYRKQGLEQLVVEDLVKAEAQKRNISEEEYFKQEVEAKVAQPSEEKVKELYDQAQASGRLPPGSKLEDMRPQIVQFLTRSQQQERVRALVEDLKKNNNVKLSLPEPARERKQVEAKGPMKGAEGAAVTIVEFSDFQCPFCSRVVPTVEQVLKDYEGKVKLYFRHFPLDFHQQAPKAAEAAACANEQGKFWEFHDALFKNQQALQVADLKKHAADLKLDSKKFDECLDSGRMKAQVDADLEAGKKAGVSGTPAFFINGIFLNGAQPYEEFKSVIDAELASKS